MTENSIGRNSAYEHFGVRPIINAQGTTTTLGGSVMPPEVVAAMSEASRSMVLLKELDAAADRLIASVTGAEAGLVTAGANAAMLVQAAAVLTGTDAENVRKLPDTDGMKNEIMVPRHHMGMGYLQAWRAAGATLVEADIEPAEFAEEAVEMTMKSVTNNTAAIGYIASRWLKQEPEGFMPLLTVAARKAGVPVIVDAAAMLPPFENLSRYTDEGVDLVCFSGGKAIRGPQSTGVLAGKKELVEAARMNAAPNSGIGRPAKVCKEEVIGLMTALEMYAAQDHAAVERHWSEQAGIAGSFLTDIPGVRAEVMQDNHSRPVPELAIFFENGYSGPDSNTVAKMLLDEEPRIVMGGASVRGEDLYVNPHNMADGEAEVVGKRLRKILSAG